MSTQDFEKTAAQAIEHLVQTVQRPIFFAKLAAQGLVPQTDEQRVELLNLGDMLLTEELSKQAAAKDQVTSKLAQINQKVAQRLQKQGHSVPGVAQPATNPGLQAFLTKLASDADTKLALDTYKLALAGQLGQ